MSDKLKQKGKLEKKDILFIISIVAIPLIIILSIKIVGLFGYSFVKVTTDSMNPTICKNDWVIIKEWPIGEVKNNDIVLFEILEDVSVIHRVIEVSVENNEIILVTKGDANNDVDKWAVNESTLKGKIIYIINIGG